jgi:hypothetical protein
MIDDDGRRDAAALKRAAHKSQQTARQLEKSKNDLFDCRAV